MRELLLSFLFILTSLFKFEVRAQEVCSGDLTQKIACYESTISKLKDSSKTLSSQISQFDAQIKLTSLKIAKTEEQIDLLSGRIDKLEGSLDSLTAAFSQRVIETYRMSKIEDPFVLLFSSKNLNDVFGRLSYLKKAQDSDRNLLLRLQKAKDNYNEEKVDQETLQLELEKQKGQLDSQKLAKKTLLDQTKSDEKRYQQLLSEAKAQLAALSRFVSNQGGASILSNQTKCDSWGCYYNQRDSQWGNIGLGGSNYSVASYGCLVSSVSMIASHYGKNVKPIDIATNSSAFVPGTGYLYHSFSAAGINFTISRAQTSILDSELGAGRPVIAGLYSGPDHFIVILKKENGQYIMHDPFLENGSSRPLTDKYNVSDITSLRLVSFR